MTVCGGAPIDWGHVVSITVTGEFELGGNVTDLLFPRYAYRDVGLISSFSSVTTGKNPSLDFAHVLNNMTTYTLQVDIDPAVLPTLHQSGYKLCIAKKVNQQYNVVWIGNATYLQFNPFNWQEDYQVFATQSYQSGAIVQSYTVDQNISFGQTCVLDAGGILEPATGTPDDSGTFYFDDKFATIHAGVTCITSGSYAPIYVSPSIVLDQARISPIPTLLVWFDLDLTTSMIFFETIPNTVEVSYAPGTTSHTISFNGHWTIGTFGQAIAQPRRSYNSSVGFKYEDSGLDPFTFIDAARRYIPNSTDVVYPSSGRVTECKLSFQTANDADNARAYLEQKIIFNIHQIVSDKTDDVTFRVKLQWAYVVFMPEMMAGSTDEEKIQNAFNTELKLLAVSPTSSHYIIDDKSNIRPSPCVLFSYGTRHSLERDPHSKLVVGKHYKKGYPDQEWKFVASPNDGYFNITGVSRDTYLSIDGEPKSGIPVIHSPNKMDWKVEFVGNAISISVPDADYCVELGEIDSEKHIHLITLADLTNDTRQLWKIMYPLTAKT